MYIKKHEGKDVIVTQTAFIALLDHSVMQHLSSPPPTLLVFTQVGFEHLHQDEHQLLRRVLPGDKSRRTDFPQDGDLPPAQAAV